MRSKIENSKPEMVKKKRKSLKKTENFYSEYSVVLPHACKYSALNFKV